MRERLTEPGTPANDKAARNRETFIEVLSRYPQHNIDPETVQSVTLQHNGKVQVRAKTECHDCRARVHETGEYYMLHNELWLEAFHSNMGHLCIGCVEDRLGRELTRADFTDAPVNDPSAVDWVFSERLLDRLSRKYETDPVTWDGDQA